MKPVPAGLDLDPEEWSIVLDILSMLVPGHEVWAFGSRAKGNAKPYSDLDLAIITGQPLTMAIKASLREAFSESDLPWQVDVVDWATASPEFRSIITAGGVVIQQAAKNTV